MLEKIGHIKNPLTVIAMFAGIAEVSGTIVLPFVAEAAQVRYVWFLMLFPCLLVGLFFLTLWLKHHVLYAPSDFQDDQNFVNMFIRPTVTTVIVPDAGSQPPPPQIEASEPEPPIVAVPEPEPEPAASPEVQDVRAEYGVPAESQITPSYARSTLKVQAINRLSAEFGSEFVLDVSPVKHPDKKFDFMMNSQDSPCVGTIFYSFNKLETVDNVYIERAFMNAYSFWRDLNSDSASRFIFAAVVVGENIDHAHRASLTNRIQRIALRYKFQTLVKVWDVSALSGHPIT